MELPRRLANALQSISDAVDLLDAAAGGRVQADTNRADVRGELAVMQDDRMRLAGELGRSLARNQALLSANSEVGERLDRVAATVRALLSEQPETAAPALPNEASA